MKYITLRNGVAEPIIERKQLYYVSRWKITFHQSFEEPTNISEQIAIFNQLNNKITIPANTKSKLLITLKCNSYDLSKVTGTNGSGTNDYIELGSKSLLGHYFKQRTTSSGFTAYQQLSMFNEKTNIFERIIRNIEYNFEKDNSVTVYENSNYITENTFNGGVLKFSTSYLNQSYGGSFEYNPSILDIKFLTYQ